MHLIYQLLIISLAVVLWEDGGEFCFRTGSNFSW